MSINLSGAEDSSYNHKSPETKPGMQIEKLGLEDTGSFSSIFLGYINKEPKLKKFYNQYPSIENFKEVIEKKVFTSEQRALLSGQLQNQYSGLACNLRVSNNISLLKEKNTFTVTTGHQLNIFSGPLYFIYKIVTTINLAKALKAEYPDYHFVPVYWMASEDHDFEEINHFNLFSKKYIWETKQTGAVGRFNPAELAELLNTLPEKPEIFEKAYLENNSLAGATRYFVNELFGNEGLVVIDGDSPSLKTSLLPVIQDDLVKHTAHSLVQKASDELAGLGYKVQVYPREINLFYLDDNSRNRIVKENKYKILNKGLEFSEQEILKLAEKEPEKFSPNVILRPLYQEIILPNIAYIGGPAEIAYWLQLKPLFDSYHVAFPILMPRNFGLVVNKTIGKKIAKLNVPLKTLFLDLQSLKNKFILENTEHNISLQQEKKVLKQVFSSILHKATAIEQSLEGVVNGESVKTLKSIENLEKRLKKAEEQNQEVAIKQIENIKEKLFPNDSLQERSDNFLNFYINNPNFIQSLLLHFDALDFKFNILIENE